MTDAARVGFRQMSLAKSLALQTPAEKRKVQYRDQLKKKYGHLPQVKRIARHKHVPLNIYNSKKKKSDMIQAAKVKMQRRMLHTKPGTVIEKRAKESAVDDVME